MQKQNKKSLINFRGPAQNNFMAPNDMQQMGGNSQLVNHSKH